MIEHTDQAIDVNGRERRMDPVLIIALAQLFSTSMWFSANSAADDLLRAWSITASDIGLLTASVQIGFILGTMVFAVTGIADRYPASRIFAVCSILGATFNVMFACLSAGLTSAIVLRFLVGLSLAGIYPIGMKLIIGWAPRRAPTALALLVGMLTLGTALPHGMHMLASSWPWQYVIATSSLLAVIAAAVIYAQGDGSHRPCAARTALRGQGALTAFRNPRFRAVAIGYFGHMWELYTFWTLVPMLVLRAALNQRLHSAGSSGLSFAIIATGALGCVLAGVLTRWISSEKIAAGALAISGACCLLFPLVAEQISAEMLFAFMLVWGAAVVADSPQFSALAAKECPPNLIGSALAIQNSIGFALTVVSIGIATSCFQRVGFHVAWLLLPGPVIGLLGFLPRWGRR